MRASRPALAASGLLVLEGLALAGVGAVQVVALGSGQTVSTMNAIGLIGLTFVAAVALIAFAVGTLRGGSWARSGGVVFQVLGLVLALSSLTIEPKIWTFTLVIGGAGLIGLVLLLLATRHDGAADPRLRGSDRDAEDESAD